jgi:hypothetical protein
MHDHERLRRLLLRRAAVVASAAMRVPVACKILELNRGQRSLVFHERVDAASAVANALAERGHSATVYHSKIGPYVRRSNLRLYRRGVFDILVTCRALDEGLNVPETTVAVIASSTASSRQRIQRLGRVLRPAPGKDRATIYTIYASDQDRRESRRDAVVRGVRAPYPTHPGWASSHCLYKRGRGRRTGPAFSAGPALPVREGVVRRTGSEGGCSTGAGGSPGPPRGEAWDWVVAGCGGGRAPLPQGVTNRVPDPRDAGSDRLLPTLRPSQLRSAGHPQRGT